MDEGKVLPPVLLPVLLPALFSFILGDNCVKMGKGKVLPPAPCEFTPRDNCILRAARITLRKSASLFPT